MAIDDLLDEHEQSERVLEWLRTNGAGLIGGIVLGLAAIGGWKWWQQHDLQQDLAAADSYHAAVSAIEANDEQAAAKVAALEDGVFANLSALELAAAQVDAGEIDKAIVTLRAIKPGNPASNQISRYSLWAWLKKVGSRCSKGSKDLKTRSNAPMPAPNG